MIDLRTETVLTPEQAAQRCGVHIRTLRSWYQRKERPLRIGRLGNGPKAKVITSIEALNEFQADSDATPAPSRQPRPSRVDVDQWRAAMRAKHKV